MILFTLASVEADCLADLAIPMATRAVGSQVDMPVNREIRLHVFDEAANYFSKGEVEPGMIKVFSDDVEWGSDRWLMADNDPDGAIRLEFLALGHDGPNVILVGDLLSVVGKDVDASAPWDTGNGDPYAVDFEDACLSVSDLAHI